MKIKKTTTLIGSILLIICISLISAIMYYSLKPQDKIEEEIDSIESQSSLINPEDLEFGSFRITEKELDILQNSSPEKYLLSNKIWSSVTTSNQLLGSYFFPFALQLADGGLIVDIPQIMDDEKLVQSNISRNGFYIKAENPVTKVTLKKHSDLLVEFDFLDISGTSQFSAVAGQGVPFVKINPGASKSFTINNGRFVNNNLPRNVFQDESNEIIISDNVVINSVTELTTTKNQPLILAANQKNNVDSRIKLIEYINEFNTESIDVEFALSDSKAITKYNFNGAGENNIFGFLPHHSFSGESLYKIKTIRGEMSFAEIGKSAETEIDIEPIEKSIKLKDKNDPKLLELLIADTESALNIEAFTSYFGGKDLARIARLIEIAEELEAGEQKKILIDKLNELLTDWFEYSPGESNRYFEYNKSTGVITAIVPEFGSEESNDHHFHYGYFLYAASVLADQSDEFQSKYRDFVNLLINDVAGLNKDDERFPFVRYFDFYEGHSWASGLSPFASGNNQESSSEAINMWYSLWRWGQATDDEFLSKAGKYLYTTEVSATKNYWLNDNGILESISSKYEPNKIGILWGGKYEYSTFFNGSPTAVEGIQYLPITPGSLYLNNPERIQRDWNYFESKGISFTDKSLPLIDYNIAYYAIDKGWDVIDKKDIEIIPIDNGNSATNLYHWISYWDEQK